MNLNVNGKQKEVPAGLSLENLVQDFGFSASAVIVEHNRRALKRTEWTSVQLKDGDDIELVRIVAGG